MPGLQLVMEGVRQMRGTSVNQVKDAATCVVSNQGGIMTTHSTIDPGSLSDELSAARTDAAVAALLGCAEARAAHVPALPQVRPRLAAAARRMSRMPRGRMGLDRRRRARAAWSSWVIYHHAYHEAFQRQLPYNVALVELDEGPRLITNIVNPEAGIEGRAAGDSENRGRARRRARALRSDLN